MAPVQTGPGGPFSDTFFDMYNSVGEYMSRRGAYVTVDAHNYIRYGSANRTGTDGGGTIGNSSDPKAATSEQSAIDGIRAAGASQLILAPSNGYTGAQVWTMSSVSRNGI
ncbi:hypothetical protein KC354_g6465 [Hortaea werneckii]|nr:hypothetical protein KC354_g6465 [Hortaea werneckii]